MAWNEEMVLKQKKQKKQDIVFWTLCILLAVSAIGLLVVLVLPEKKGSFVPPALEAAAESGLPEVSETLGYTELYQDGMAYRVSVCGIPVMEEKNAVVYFTNVQENACYLKLRVLDSSDRMLGETGLLRPGEYVRTVALTKELPAGTTLKLKVMSYHPETYESEGTVVLRVSTGKGGN